MLMSALAPAVSHALPAWGSKAGWVDICSATGDKAQPAIANGPADTGVPVPAMAGLGMDCAYCLLQAHQVALPATAAPALTPPSAGPLAAPRIGARPQRKVDWASAQPRAPPV